MKDFKTFKEFLNESHFKIVDYSNSPNIIIVGKNNLSILDKLENDYIHIVVGNETRFYSKYKHFATLYDNPKGSDVIKHDGTLNQNGTRNKK